MNLFIIIFVASMVMFPVAFLIFVMLNNTDPTTCDDCGHDLEFWSARKAICPGCGKETL